MDAQRVIKTARHALAEARTVPDALSEAWQAGLLTEAIGARIAEQDIGEVGALGQLLCDAGGHAASCLEPPPDESGELGGNRVERLGELGEIEPVLRELGLLLHEAAETLVVLACGADSESLYWRCIDGVDAGAECKDVVAELLRTFRQGSDGCGGFPEEGPEMDSQDPGDPETGRGMGRRAEREARLLVQLGPPGGSGPGQSQAELLCSSGPGAGKDCRPAPRPARSVLMAESSACICSSSDAGVAGGGAVSCGAAGASDHVSDMRGPLQLGSAV